MVIGILILLFAFPVFDISVGYYGSPPGLDQGGLAMLHASYGAGGWGGWVNACPQCWLGVGLGCGPRRGRAGRMRLRGGWDKAH